MYVFQVTIIFVISCLRSETFGQWQESNSREPQEYFPEIRNYFQSEINSAPYPARYNPEYNSHHPAIPPSYNTGEFSLDMGQNNRRPPNYSVNLFTPNTIDQPAETQGQIEMYRKDLEEIARERNGMASNATMDNGGTSQMMGESMESSEHYVNFNHRDFSYAYSV